MRIKSLHLENFRGFEKADVDLNRQVTVLMGTNGSGKTSVLDALRWTLTEVLRRNWGADGVSWGWAPELCDLRSGTEAGLVKAELLFDSLCTACYFAFQRDEATLKTTGAAPEVSPKWKSRLLPIFYDVARGIERAKHGCATTPVDSFDLSKLCCTSPSPLSDVIHAANNGFRGFFQWFKAQEDAENRLKVHRRDLGALDPQLSAVRQAFESVLPGYTDLCMQGEAAYLSVRKGNTVLSFPQLSEGERALIILTADIARRLAIAYPKAENPLQEGHAVVLVDEIELHLHAQWQRSILPMWQRVFPMCQFIVSTHSAEVAGSVSSDAVVFIDNAQTNGCTPPSTPRGPRRRRQSEERYLQKTKLARFWRR